MLKFVRVCSFPDFFLSPSKKIPAAKPGPRFRPGNYIQLKVSWQANRTERFCGRESVFFLLAWKTASFVQAAENGTNEIAIGVIAEAEI